MFDFRSHDLLGTRRGEMTPVDHPAVKLHSGGAEPRCHFVEWRTTTTTSGLAMSRPSVPSASGGAGGSVQPPRRDVRHSNAATTPRVGGAEDDLSLLLCQPRPTCLRLAPPTRHYRTTSASIPAAVTRNQLQHPSSRGPNHPRRYRYVAFRGCVAARCISNGPARETSVSVAHRLIGQSGARCHYTPSDPLLLPTIGCPIDVLRLPVIPERQHAISASPQRPRRTSSWAYTKPA